jgi:hypothetical protein
VYLYFRASVLILDFVSQRKVIPRPVVSDMKIVALTLVL